VIVQHNLSTATDTTGEDILIFPMKTEEHHLFFPMKNVHIQREKKFFLSELDK
jgi:hypothetical protein